MLSVVGKVRPLMLYPVPDKFACEMVTLPPPVLVIVADSDEVLPTCTLPNPKLVGVAATVPTGGGVVLFCELLWTAWQPNMPAIATTVIPATAQRGPRTFTFWPFLRRKIHLRQENFFNHSCKLVRIGTLPNVTLASDDILPVSPRVR